MADRRSPRALVVDDDPFVRDALTGSLRNAGYDVSAADSGEAAVRLAALLVPEVVVMDVIMPPGISGIEATRRIVEHDSAVRVVMFSVHRSPDIVAAALAAGATSYVAKENGAGHAARRSGPDNGGAGNSDARADATDRDVAPRGSDSA